MRPILSLSVLSAALIVGPALAQERVPAPAAPERAGGKALVDAWIHQLLDRAPNREDLRHGEQIDEGKRDPISELAAILGCEEYYLNRADGSNRGFVRTIFRDAVGRPPAPQEADAWLDRLRDLPAGETGRTEFALKLLRQYPSRLLPDQPVPEDIDRRP